MRVDPAVQPPTRTPRRLLLPVVLALWAITTLAAFDWLWGYESTPGQQHAAPAAIRPGDIGDIGSGSNSRGEGKTRPASGAAKWGNEAGRCYTLLVFLHPKCPCSRATVSELARLTARAGDRLTTRVYLVLPDGAGDDWLATPMRTSAAVIPGVTVEADRGGAIARRYGAATSGQAVLYAPDGRLAFTGGITASRGHEGDNAGESAILDAIYSGAAGASPARTPVFGCALFDTAADTEDTGTAADGKNGNRVYLSRKVHD